MAVGHTEGSQRKLWALKVIKLSYIAPTSLDFENEDSYLHFAFSTNLQNLLLDHPRNCLIFEEVG